MDFFNTTAASLKGKMLKGGNGDLTTQMQNFETVNFFLFPKSFCGIAALTWHNQEILGTTQGV